MSKINYQEQIAFEAAQKLHNPKEGDYYGIVLEAVKRTAKETLVGYQCSYCGGDAGEHFDGCQRTEESESPYCREARDAALICAAKVPASIGIRGIDFEAIIQQAIDDVVAKKKL